ncbi:MAG: helix-turn-helix transcriptional regulator [Sulfobacillus sp.]
MFNNPEVVFGGTDKLLSLIQQIYGAVDDASLWPAVLDGIAEAANAEGTLLFANFPHPATPDLSVVARMDASVLVPYAEHYATVNVLAQRCDEMFPEGTVRYSHLAVPDPEFDQTEFYNDYFRPNNMYYSFGLKIPLAGHSPAYLSSMRTKAQGAFEERDGLVLSTLLPHLQRALTLHLQFTQLRSNAEGMESALDMLDHALIGLNRAGVVVFSNQAAEHALRSGDGIRLTQGRLAASSAKDDPPLQLLLSEASAAGTGCGISHGGSMLLSRKAGTTPLRLTVTPFTPNLIGNYGQLAALVFVGDAARKPLPRSGVLRQIYGLSPLECRLADLLGSGCELTAAAEIMRLKYETARFHLKSILRKTGTHRQTELIRLIAGLPGSM